MVRRRSTAAHPSRPSALRAGTSYTPHTHYTFTIKYTLVTTTTQTSLFFTIRHFVFIEFRLVQVIDTSNMRNTFSFLFLIYTFNSRVVFKHYTKVLAGVIAVFPPVYIFFFQHIHHSALHLLTK